MGLLEQGLEVGEILRPVEQGIAHKNHAIA